MVGKVAHITTQVITPVITDPTAMVTAFRIFRCCQYQLLDSDKHVMRLSDMLHDIAEQHSSLIS